MTALDFMAFELLRPKDRERRALLQDIAPKLKTRTLGSFLCEAA